MGFYSWTYANRKNREEMKVSAYYNPRTSYLLVPPEFHHIYGEYITEPAYGGYGMMGGHDVYELLATWNKDCMPKCVMSDMLADFSQGIFSDEEMKERYGEEYLREAGIELFFNYHDKLKYQIKITDVIADYDSMPASKHAKYQGC